MLEFANTRATTAKKILEVKEQELQQAEELPTKSKFDEFTSRFELDGQGKSVEDNFLLKFKDGTSDILAMLVFLVFTTIALYVYLYINFTDPFWKLDEAISNLPTGHIVICRSILAIFMHFLIDADLTQGLDMMKYALNHPWKFRRWYMACLIGLTQFAMAFMTEYVSIQVILSTSTYIDAVKDFIALIVVNELDNYLFNYQHKDDFHKIIVDGEIEVGTISLSLKDILKVETTTSYRPDQDDRNNAEPLSKLEPIYKNEAVGMEESKSESPYTEKTCCSSERPILATTKFSDRKFLNKVIRILYLVLKISYMSIWFYWGGYIVPIASYVYPYDSDKHLEPKQKLYDLYATDEGIPGKAKPKHDERGFTYEDFVEETDLWYKSDHFCEFFAIVDPKKRKVEQD